MFFGTGGRNMFYICLVIYVMMDVAMSGKYVTNELALHKAQNITT